MAVFQHPIAILVFDGRLHFWYQLVVDSNVRVWRSAYDEFLLFILADDNVGVLQIIWWEDFQLQLVRNVRASLTWLLRIFIVIARLVTDQVWDDVGFSDVAEEAVSNNDRALKFGESTIAFSQISDFVLSVKRIELDIKLPSLVVVTASEHRICRWLLYLLAGIRIVRVCSGNDKVVHLFFEDLFPGHSVLNIATCGSVSILWALFIVFALDSVFLPKICKSIKFLTAWQSRQHIVLVELIIWLVWDDTCGVHHEDEILFEVGRTQDLKIERRYRSLCDEFLKHHLLSLVSILVEVVLDLLHIKDIELILALLVLLRWRLHISLLRHKSILVLICIWLKWRVVRTSVARSVLVLTVSGSIRLIVVLPLLVLLVFDHLLHFFTHRLRQLPIRIQRRLMPGLCAWLLRVVDVHATSTSKVSIAKHHSFKALVVL